MGFFRKLLGGGPAQSSDDGLYLFVRCAKCATPVRVRISLANDLAAEYGDNDTEGYTLTKEIMDDRCFRVMHATLTFDSRKRELGREVEGGSFISQAEYTAWQTANGKTA